MKKSLLVPAIAALGICIGCNTGPEDVTKAETEYQKTQRDGEKLVAVAQQEGTENVHETRKIVLDDVNAETREAKEALEDERSVVARERADVEEAVRKGDKEIMKAEAEKQKEVAEAKVAADKKIAKAKHDLEETKRKAIEDGQKRITECEEAVTKQQKELTDAKAEVAAAETRLKDATDDNRADLQSKLEDARKVEQEEVTGVSEAKAALEKENAELKKVVAKVN